MFIHDVYKFWDTIHTHLSGHSFVTQYFLCTGTCLSRVANSILLQLRSAFQLTLYWYVVYLDIATEVNCWHIDCIFRWLYMRLIFNRFELGGFLQIYFHMETFLFVSGNQRQFLTLILHL